MKREVAEYVAFCDVCQRVKAEHQKPAGLLQPQDSKVEVGGNCISSTDRWVDRKNQPDIRRHASIKMSPFQALYGRWCRTPLHWDQTGEKQLFGPEIIEDAERQVRMIRENLRIAQTRQKSYADNRRRDLEFAVGDYVYLKVSPIHGLRRFKVKGKLVPRYIGLFKIIDRKGEVAYQLELPDRLSGVHDVFHVSQLKKCLRVLEEQLQVDELTVQDDLTYTEHLVQILETAERTNRNRVIKMCKVKWSHHTAEEATWEREDDLRVDYPELFASQS
ncbi:hypothetical protein U9M48_035340 [Paspalum notatum var. saurae]|uniref:Tf2-1-like SH3-like domain-containing protein n=1 Tax=Paspalum notatum var. saurae TaxID=547442 RepID=A0AAQ3X7K9_PASNO